MPLIDRLRDKWRARRIERLRGEESRQRVFGSLDTDRKRRACEEISVWLKQADIKAGNSIRSDDFYSSEAEKKIKGFRWNLFILNLPFRYLEKSIIEPLDFWSDRANLFQFFTKASPLLQAVGVLAIPFVLLFYEIQRDQRQLEFEDERNQKQLEFQRNTIASQDEVRKQQAVRAYLSQITTIYLSFKDSEKIKEDDDLKKLLKGTTLAIFEELSVSESPQDETEEDELRKKVLDSDRKGDVIEFLYQLDWISGDDPLLSLSDANLSQTNLGIVVLNKIDLSEANLSDANLIDADLGDTEMRNINLNGANLSRANLNRAFLKGADLRGAYLSEANLRGAYLIGADLRGAFFGGAIFCNTIMPDETANDRDCEESEE